MTINAPAAWLLGLYVAHAEDKGVASTALRGTTQNDVVKEYLSRGTYIFPPLPSRLLIVVIISFFSETVPLFNPINLCIYHLQAAGSTPFLFLPYILSTAILLLVALPSSFLVYFYFFPSVFSS